MFMNHCSNLCNHTFEYMVSDNNHVKHSMEIFQDLKKKLNLDQRSCSANSCTIK